MTVAEAAISDYIAIVNADVVECPRLSQQVRLEREQATCYYSVCDLQGQERGIFYAWDAAFRFAVKHNHPHIDKKKILRQY